MLQKKEDGILVLDPPLVRDLNPFPNKEGFFDQACLLFTLGILPEKYYPQKPELHLKRLYVAQYEALKPVNRAYESLDEINEFLLKIDPDLAVERISQSVFINQVYQTIRIMKQWARITQELYENMQLYVAWFLFLLENEGIDLKGVKLTCKEGFALLKHKFTDILNLEVTKFHGQQVKTIFPDDKILLERATRSPVFAFQEALTQSYGLQASGSKWHPKAGIELIEQDINKYGYLFVAGRMGRTFYTKPAQKTSLAGVSVLAWSPADYRDHGKTSHAILVVGVIKKGYQGVNKDYILYADPSFDQPGPAKMYACSYDSFCQRIVPFMIDHPADFTYIHPLAWSLQLNRSAESLTSATSVNVAVGQTTSLESTESSVEAMSAKQNQTRIAENIEARELVASAEDQEGSSVDNEFTANSAMSQTHLAPARGGQDWVSLLPNTNAAADSLPKTARLFSRLTTADSAQENTLAL